MQFVTPTQHHFEIPDDWWHFAEMDKWNPGEYQFYPPPANVEFDKISIKDIKPPSRTSGSPLFKKYKLVPVLFAFQSPECALPPIQLSPDPSGIFRYQVQNGFHRYYASIAVGYVSVPVIPIDLR